MLNPPNRIGPDNFELWTGRIELDPSLTTTEVQAVVTQCVTESYINGQGISVVGYHTERPSAFTMQRWPDCREGYPVPTLEQCDAVLRALAIRFGSVRLVTGIVPEGRMHVVMGRNKDGYDAGEVVPLAELQGGVPDASVVGGYLVSAQVSPNGIESYGEPVGIIVADPSDEEAIHNLGTKVKQHHYAIEHGPRGDLPGRIDLWETRWSPTYVMADSDLGKRLLKLG